MEPVNRYKVQFEEDAIEDYKALDRRIQNNLAPHIQRMKTTPTHTAQQIRGAKTPLPLYKKRVGDYRLFFIIDSKNHEVKILTISHREDDLYDPSEIDDISKRYSGPVKKKPKKSK